MLRPWQRRIVLRIYDNPKVTRRVIVSFGRKNAKTALAAFLTLLHLCGPEARRNSQLYSAAQAKEQAAILFELAAKCVRLSPELDQAVLIRDTNKHLLCQELGTIYRAISADVPTSYGKSPVFVVHDELGQVKGPRSELYTALESGMGAHEAPLSIVISTQAPTDADLLSALIDDAAKGDDPQTVLELYTAPMEMDPFSEEAIRAANPAFGDFQDRDEVLKSAAQAKRMPSMEAAYRNLILNQRVEAVSPFVSRSVWKSNGLPPVASFSGLSVYLGLDLSEVSDLTAGVAVALHEDAWHVHPTFWLPAEGLLEKARKDRVAYDLWHEQGFLQTTPGRSIEYRYVADWLYDLYQTVDLQKVAFDRYNMRHLKPWLIEAGFTEDQIAEVFVEFGQGFASMSPALRTFEELLLQDKLRHGMHPVLTMCAAHAVVTGDDAGNRKLTKAKSRGRIDGMVALAMALSVASTAEPVTRWIYEIEELWPA